MPTGSRESHTYIKLRYKMHLNGQIKYQNTDTVFGYTCIPKQYK